MGGSKPKASSPTHSSWSHSAPCHSKRPTSQSLVKPFHPHEGGPHCWNASEMPCEWPAVPARGNAGCERDNVPSALLETFSEVLAGGHTRSCKMLQPQMQAIQPRISIGAQPGGAFKGSACCAELTTVWTCWGCTDPSARCKCWKVTCVLPSGRSYHSKPLLRTSVN